MEEWDIFIGKSELYHDLQMRGGFRSCLRRQWPGIKEWLYGASLVVLGVLTIALMGGRALIYCQAIH